LCFAHRACLLESPRTRRLPHKLAACFALHQIQPKRQMDALSEAQQSALGVPCQALQSCLEAAAQYLRDSAACGTSRTNSPYAPDLNACSDEAAMLCLHTAVDFFESFQRLGAALQQFWLGCESLGQPTVEDEDADHQCTSSSSGSGSGNTVSTGTLLPLMNPTLQLGPGISTAIASLAACSHAAAAADETSSARTLASAASHVAAAVTPLAEHGGSITQHLQASLTDSAFESLGGLLNAAGSTGSHVRCVGLLNALLRPEALPRHTARKAFLTGLTEVGSAADALQDPSGGPGDWFWGVELGARCCAPASERGSELLLHFAVQRKGLQMVLQGLREYILHPPLRSRPLSRCIAVVHAGVLVSNACKNVRVRTSLLELSPNLVKTACCVFVAGFQLAHAEQHSEGMQFAASGLCDLMVVESDAVLEGYITSDVLRAVSNIALQHLTSNDGAPLRMEEGPGGVMALLLCNLAGCDSQALQAATASALPVKVLHLMLDGQAGDGAAVQAGKALQLLHANQGTKHRLALLQAVFESNAPVDAPSRLLAWLNRNSDPSVLCRTEPWDRVSQVFQACGVAATLERLALLVLALCCLLLAALVCAVWVIRSQFS